MPPSTKNDFARHIYAVRRYCAVTSPRYAPLMQGGLATHPIPCFGYRDSAVAVTLGLNPSGAEFGAGRSWPAAITHTELAARCTDYFSPRAACPPRNWFQPWSEGLDHLDVELPSRLRRPPRPFAARHQARVHPQGARPAKTLSRNGRARPLVLFATLHLCRSARLILMAGTVTGETT